MNKKVNAGDPLMLLLVFGMIVFGLVMIYSASSYTAGLQYGNAFYYVKRQIFTVIIGTVMMYMISRPDYHRILKYAWPLYGIALLCWRRFPHWNCKSWHKRCPILALSGSSPLNLRNLY